MVALNLDRVTSEEDIVLCHPQISHKTALTGGTFRNSKSRMLLFGKEDSLWYNRMRTRSIRDSRGRIVLRCDKMVKPAEYICKQKEGGGDMRLHHILEMQQN